MTQPATPNLHRAALLALDSAFINRVQAGLLFKARTLVSQGPPLDGTEAAFNYAMGIARNPGNYSRGAAWVIVTDPEVAGALTNAPSDADLGALVDDPMILRAISTAWSALAGIGA